MEIYTRDFSAWSVSDTYILWDSGEGISKDNAGLSGYCTSWLSREGSSKLPWISCFLEYISGIFKF